MTAKGNRCSVGYVWTGGSTSIEPQSAYLSSLNNNGKCPSGHYWKDPIDGFGVTAPIPW